MERCPKCNAVYCAGTYHECPEKPDYPEVEAPSVIINDSAIELYGTESEIPNNLQATNESFSSLSGFGIKI